MATYPMRTPVRKRYPFAEIPADLFAWADAQAASAAFPETHAERALMQRLSVPLHMARVIIENANLGGRA
ncbi:MAG: hypothetical protein FD175_1366 [Beijerinckiaceae bacterium]|nr:MAG: hypothetical protein FD175_1366 [Beijerinckiaceae bacterium]